MAKGKYQKWLEPEGLLLLEGWARDGLTDEQIAHNMGITRKTLYDWKAKYGDICNALKKGKDVVDTQVENALLKRALGYDYQEQRIEVSEKDGKKVIQTTKHVAPDVGAAAFWLKNRRPDKWRDKPVPDKTDKPQNNLFDQLEASLNELSAIQPETTTDAALVENTGADDP